MHKFKQPLFVYGTLEVPQIMRRITGSCYVSQPAVLSGYARYMVKNKPYPAIVEQAASNTPGYLYPYVTTRDLRQLDIYEGDLYHRSAVTVTTIRQMKMLAWVYVLKQEYSYLLTKNEWNRRIFCHRSMSTYLSTL